MNTSNFSPPSSLSSVARTGRRQRALPPPFFSSVMRAAPPRPRSPAPISSFAQLIPSPVVFEEFAVAGTERRERDPQPLRDERALGRVQRGDLPPKLLAPRLRLTFPPSRRVARALGRLAAAENHLPPVPGVHLDTRKIELVTGLDRMRSCAVEPEESLHREHRLAHLARAAEHVGLLRVDLGSIHVTAARLPHPRTL